jgi:excisionase family DNA binding protein
MEILTVEDVAKFLKISKSYAYKLAESGKIPYVKLGKSLRFDKEDVIRWFEEQKKTGNKTNKIMED